MRRLGSAVEIAAGLGAGLSAALAHWWGRFAMRYFLGYARGCETGACSSTLGLPYFGMGFGVAF